MMLKDFIYFLGCPPKFKWRKSKLREATNVLTRFVRIHLQRTKELRQSNLMQVRPMFRAVRAWIDRNYKIKFQKTIYNYLIAVITVFIYTLKDRVIQFADAALLSF